MPAVKKYLWCADNLAHVPFLDPVTVFECDYGGCSHEIVDHDIILRIPKGAIPNGKIVHIEVAVALYGPFEFCENQRPISPILWICPQENIDLQEPIEIVLPHILTNMTHQDVQRFGITCTKANHEDYTMDHSGYRKYKFQPCEVELVFAHDGMVPVGVLKTKHFCFLCIAASKDHNLSHELALKKGYCLTCVECVTPNARLPQRDVIYFCTSFFLGSCLNAVKEQYPADKGHKIRPYHYTMKGSHLELHVSDDDKKVCSIAMKPMKVKHSDIDFWEVWGVDYDQMELLHQERMYPPRIEMMAELKQSSTHVLSVHLSGCKDELVLQFLLPLAIDASSTPRTPTTNKANPMNCDHYKVENQFFSQIEWREGTETKTVKIYDESAHRWKKIGEQLGLEPGQLVSIRRDNHDDRERVTMVLGMWYDNANNLKNSHLYPKTWSGLIALLNSSDLGTLAYKLFTALSASKNSVRGNM